MPLCRPRPGVCLVKPVHIPPRSELLVMGSTDESGEGTFILESSASRTRALVARALVSPEQDRVPVSLLNPEMNLSQSRLGLL